MPRLAELLVFWTVRLSVVLYFVALGLRLSNREMKLARAAWLLGCITFVIHVAAAFHFVHHWSHAEAFAATAQQTHALTGIDWGGGIYFNYLFMLVWAGDVAWWWLQPAGYLTRSRFIEWPVQGYLAFIVFNATVVFGSGPARWLGVVGFIGFGLMMGLNLRRSTARVIDRPM